LIVDRFIGRVDERIADASLLPQSLLARASIQLPA